MSPVKSRRGGGASTTGTAVTANPVGLPGALLQRLKIGTV